MCGLIATTSADIYGTSAWMAGMRVLECRGPDSHGQQCEGGVGLGHRRLEIIGLGSPGLQPYTRSDDALVFNGEIYNYRELAEELAVPADSDTHVLYEILRRGDQRLVNKLRGMYAFVYSDPTRDVVITGRDPFGIKPLYALHHADGNVSFASVAGALTGLPDAGTLDATSIAGFLATGFFPEGTSPLRGLEKQPPGVVRTWQRAANAWVPSDTRLDFSQWQTLSVPQALRRSVDAHLVADVPVGVLLSGGVDSTLIAALARQSTDELRTYSITNPDHPELDESEIAAWNARLLGTIHTEVPVRPADLAAQTESVIRSSGEPFGDAAYLPLSLLCRQVAEDLKVVMAGEGADELFGGYKRYDIEKYIYNRYTSWPVRAAGRLAGGERRYQSQSPSQAVRSLAAAAVGPGALSHGILMGANWQPVSAALPQAAGAALARYQRRWDALGSSPLSLGFPPNRSFDLQEWLPNVFLEKSDRASMLHSLEIRVPFLDPEVALAAAQYRPRDSSKAPLRSELHRLLPEVRLPDHKKGLAVSTAEVVQTPELRGYLAEELNGGGVLGEIGVRSTAALQQACEVSPGLAFRLATLGMWREIWLS